MENDDYRDVPLTLAVALTPWAAAVAAGTSAGVFSRLPGEALALTVSDNCTTPTVTQSPVWARRFRVLEQQQSY